MHIEGRPPFFFPAGPETDGVRTVRVDLPAPRVLVLPADARDVVLLDEPREAYAYPGEEAGHLLTDAAGPLRVLWNAPDGTRREAEVVLPEAAGSRVAVHAADARVVHETSHIRALDVDGSVHGTRDATPGTWVVFELRAVSEPSRRA